MFRNQHSGLASFENVEKEIKRDTSPRELLKQHMSMIGKGLSHKMDHKLYTGLF
jgi:hypothetical protein